MGLTTAYVKKQHLGVIIDQAPEVVPEEFWTTAVNATFPDQCSKSAEGYAQYASPLPVGVKPIYGGSVNNVLSDVNQWIYMTTDKIYVTDGQTHTDITPAGGLVPCDVGEWTFTKLGGLPVFNNPNNPPMYWDLDDLGTAEVLPGWPDGALCRSLRAVKYHLVALNITEGGINYPSQVWWSEGAQAGAIPAEWIPTAENDAGDSILGDSAGGIVDAVPLRDQLIIYKNSSTYIMQYVAGQYVYAFRKLFPSVGIQAINCAAEIDGMHYVFTGEDVIAHDGQNFESVVDKRVQRTLVESIDKDQLLLCNVVARIVERQVWICIPVSGEDLLSFAFVINTTDGLIGSISLPNVASVARGTIDPAGVEEQTTWTGYPGVWNRASTIWTQSIFSPTNDSLMLFQTESSKLLAYGQGSSADGEAIESVLERLSMRIGNDIHHSVVTQIAPQMECPEGVEVLIRLGKQDYFNDPITWLPAQTFTVGTTKAVNQIIDGRYLSVRFQITAAENWKLFGYFLKMKEAGEY